jgi:hypothetical protein|nr:hypothetical protein [Kofleriaceae bacterium]
MRTLRFLGALAVTAAAAAPAHAQAVASSSSNEVRDVASPPAARFWDARVGMLAGVADVGDSDGGSIGVTGAYGYHIGDLGLRAELAYYRVGDDSDSSPRRGRGERAAALARYTFVSADPDGSLIAALWGEAGAGYEHVAWNTGGVLDRPDAELAVGLDVGMHRDRDRSQRSRRVGYFMDIRSWIGEGPAVAGAMPSCGGPCTMATTPPRTDISMFFEFGVLWGR